MSRIAALLLTVFAIVAALPQHSYAQSDMAMVRVMHASPDAPAVDVYVNGDAVLTNVPFFALSDSLAVPAGTYRIQVAPTGAGLGSAVLDATLPLNAGTAYTIAAVNRVAAIEPLVLVDDTSPVPAGKSRVRLLHASPDAPAVDIKLAGTSTVVLAGAAFRDSAYLEVDKGTYRFDISPAGSSDVVFTTPELRFESGWIYTLVAAGFLTQPNEDTPGFWVQSRVDRID
jgi:hypothetical protein